MGRKVLLKHNFPLNKHNFHAGPQTGPEAITQVLAAKSVFDVITIEDGALNQKRLERQLKQLANLVDPDARENAGDKERTRQANRSLTMRLDK